MLCVRSTLDIAVRVEFMARHVPSMYPHRREMIQVEASETLFVSFPCINSPLALLYIRRARPHTQHCQRARSRRGTRVDAAVSAVS